ALAASLLHKRAPGGAAVIRRAQCGIGHELGPPGIVGGDQPGPRPPRQFGQRIVRRAVDPRRAQLQRRAPAAVGPHPAADAVAGFDDAHRPARVGKAARGGQSRQPGANDEDRRGVRGRRFVRRAAGGGRRVLRRARGRQPGADHARRGREERPARQPRHGSKPLIRIVCRISQNPTQCRDKILSSLAAATGPRSRGERSMSARRAVRAIDPFPAQLPPSKTVAVRAADGTRLHAEVFGPPDGYPIVLTHGITCAIRAWAHQIADLAGDYRVIAFDHRGHGQSSVPRAKDYSLKHLASDLDSVLDATLAPHERAVVAGHSMGGITIAAWSQRYRHKVARRADAVALINTTTGDLIRNVQLLALPRGLGPARVLAGRALIGAFAGFGVPGAARIPSRHVVAMLATGRDADPSISRLVYEL